MSLRYLSAGESHGPGLCAIAEGFPAGLTVDFDAVNRELQRRQKGYGRGGRQQIEKDEAQFLSGIRGAVTLGSPIALVIVFWFRSVPEILLTQWNDRLVDQRLCEARDLHERAIVVV